MILYVYTQSYTHIIVCARRFVGRLLNLLNKVYTYIFGRGQIHKQHTELRKIYKEKIKINVVWTHVCNLIACRMNKNCIFVRKSILQHIWTHTFSP